MSENTTENTAMPIKNPPIAGVNDTRMRLVCSGRTTSFTRYSTAYRHMPASTAGGTYSLRNFCTATGSVMRTSAKRMNTA